MCLRPGQAGEVGRPDISATMCLRPGRTKGHGQLGVREIVAGGKAPAVVGSEAGRRQRRETQYDTSKASVSQASAVKTHCRETKYDTSRVSVSRASAVKTCCRE